jgi:ATP-dependent exoDNAse (exonuclease V) beta subunit
MGEGTLTIYSASAGSGKTHKLAGIYLEKLFRSRLHYRRILAVTFTHKATAEMKSRILDELHRLDSGQGSKYLDDLTKATGKNESLIRSEAGNILYSILHDYSRFSVSTIDSFYQKIIRAFARDIGLHSGFSIEIDHARILSSAISNVIGSADSDHLVRNWLTMFARTNIDEGKSWDLKKSITGLSGELFNEKFRLLPEEEKKKIGNKEFLVSYIRDIREIRSEFRRKMKDYGLECLAYFERFSLTDDMFFQKGRGVPAFVRSAAGGMIRPPNSYARAVNENPSRWSSGAQHSALGEALKAGLEKTVKEAMKFYDDNIVFYNSAEQILSNIYILGILSDVLYHVHLITRDENTFLLSDAGELIYLIISQDQAPFIYERTGNTYSNFMIDEFQDTSVIQWLNFRHLIDNSMAQGSDNLVVGDIKQSIYRWRNSDWHTLNNLKQSSDGKRFISLPLDTNYRSCSNIIRFNNALFSAIPHLLDQETAGHRPQTSFSELYREAVQKDPGRKSGGYVKLEFIENENETDWRESVLQRLPSVVEMFQDNGYRASDIGILVRDNIEGSVVLKAMITYSMECPAEKKAKYNYNIVSGESLLLSNSPVVSFLVALLRVMDNREDMISRAALIRNYLLATGKTGVEQTDIDKAYLVAASSSIFPEGSEDFIDSVRYRTLWDITENAISFFGLGSHSFNVPYLNAFQDLVMNHCLSGNPGIASFLDWWETEGVKKSILLPENQDSIKVLTIHKSKGLEFKAVILPFISWNLDHKPFHTNILWVNPDIHPFNALGIVPVKYKSDLENSIFAGSYFQEKYSAYIDNLNLLYVAFTRAVNVLTGFAPSKSGNSSRIAGILKEAFSFTGSQETLSDPVLSGNFNRKDGIFEFGSIPTAESESDVSETLKTDNYPVSDNSASLKLKLHWEDYFETSVSEKRERINYGKIMHEIFGEILTSEDAGRSVRKKVLEGKIPESEEASLIGKIEKLLNDPEVGKWFEKGLEVYNETSFLMPDSQLKRPDRIIFKDGRATIIDFKFGGESNSHIRQIRQYGSILESMGYVVEKACLWYVDAGKIVSV